MENVFKKGITGFYSKGVEPEHTLEEVKKLIAKIRYPFLKKTELEPPHQSSNYYRIKIENALTKAKFDIVIHRFFWIIAAKKEDSDWMNLHFVDMPLSLKSQLRAPAIKILEAGYLSQKLSDSDLKKLADEEKRQVRYWNSQTKGEVIFNGYD